MSYRISIDKLDRWLERFDGRDENTRLMTLRVFLFIAQRKTTAVTDLTRDMGLVHSVAHRNLQRLYQGSVSPQVGQGLELLERFEDPESPRRHLYRLSPKGRKYLEELVG